MRVIWLLHGRDEPLVLEPLVLFSLQATCGGTEIFIRNQGRPYLYAKVTGELDHRNLSMHDAQIFTNRAAWRWIPLWCLSQIAASYHWTAIPSSARRCCKFYNPGIIANRHSLVRHPSLKLCYFNVDTSVVFLLLLTERRSYLQLTALDQPGLLARVSEIFVDLGIALHSVRLSTIGGLEGDLFILSGGKHRVLGPANVGRIVADT